MTQTNDPPLISSLELIPDAAEKADLDAPSGSGGKLVIGQAPNITITETSVVADAAERLALDVQEGDVAIQQNVSSSFIFTGGDNIAPNWQTLDFDAVGAIDSEDISPNNITALGDISGQDIDGTSFANADLSTASNGELLGSDGSGNLQFTSPPSGGDAFLNSASGIQTSGNDFITIPDGNTATLHNFNNAIVYDLIIDAGSQTSVIFADGPVGPIINFTDGTSLEYADVSGFDGAGGEASLRFGPFSNVSSIQFENFQPFSRDAFIASAVYFEEI